MQAGASPRAAAPAGDVNIVVRGIRLRRLNGPGGLMRMTGWARSRYQREVASWIRLALNRLGEEPLRRTQDEPKKLRITVVHRGVFDQDNLASSCKPLLDALKAGALKVEGRTVAVLPGLFPDDGQGWVEWEVAQERGPYGVRVEAWAPSLRKEFKGRSVEI